MKNVSKAVKNFFGSVNDGNKKNRKKKEQNQLDIFELPLEQSFAIYEAAGKKHILYDMIKYLENTGCNAEGIFRIVGMHDEVKKFKADCCKMEVVDFSKYDIHTITSALKYFCRNTGLGVNYLPWIEIKDLTNEHKENKAISLMLALPELNRNIFILILKMLKKISAASEQTRMSTQNLAIVFSSCLFTQSTNDVELIIRISQDLIIITAFLIEHIYSIENNILLIEETERTNYLQYNLGTLRLTSFITVNPNIFDITRLLILTRH